MTTRYFSMPAVLVMAALVVQKAQAQPTNAAPFSALKNVDAWKLLPRDKPALPAWALILVETLPKTTAAMIHLDYVQREQNPLGRVLYGKVRWVAADANKSDYSKRYAEADLKRAGLSDAELKQLKGPWRDLPEIDQQILAFARKMTLAAYTVTDEEVAQLLKQLGPEKLVALVHTLAHANFQDRVILALGVEVEPNGPLPPLDIRLDPDESTKVLVPPRLPMKETASGTDPEPKDRPRWVGDDASGLEKALARQKARKPRIAAPSMERFAAFPPAVQKRSERIMWSRVSLGYSPILTQAWFECMSTFDKESALDEVFANTYFWVITRSNECFY